MIYLDCMPLLNYICIMKLIVDLGSKYILEVDYFGYSKHLFLIVPVNYDVTNIPPFYQSIMNTWSLFSNKRNDTT